jgi:hypothetical protein
LANQVPKSSIASLNQAAFIAAIFLRIQGFLSRSIDSRTSNVILLGSILDSRQISTNLATNSGSSRSFCVILIENECLLVFINSITLLTTRLVSFLFNPDSSMVSRKNAGEKYSGHLVESSLL